MKTHVRDTSIAALRSIEFEGVTAQQEKEILYAVSRRRNITNSLLHDKDWSLQEIAQATGIGINAVAGRVNSLKNNSPYYLIEMPKRRCSITGRLIIPLSFNR